MHRASPRAPRREKSSFLLQLIKGIMVVENRLCCPWLLMSCLQAANEDGAEFCCLSYYITSLSSAVATSEPLAFHHLHPRCVGKVEHNAVLCIWQTKKGFFRCMPIFCGHYAGRNKLKIRFVAAVLQTSG